MTLRFGIYENAQQEPDIEERFVRAKIAADGIRGGGKIMYGIYEFTDN